MKQYAIFLTLLILLLLGSGSIEAVAENTTIDDSKFVNDFISAFIPENAKQITSNFSTNYIELEGDEFGRLKKKVKTEVRTYNVTSTCKEDIQFQSVVIVEFLDRISIANDDLLEVTVNDYLHPVSPESAWLFARDDASSEWRLVKTVIPFPTGSGVKVFGNELHGDFNQSMVLISFPSLGNPETDYSNPVYDVSFVHSEKQFSFFWCGVIVVSIGLIIVFAKRNRNHS